MKPGLELIKTACITVLGSGFAPIASGTWGSLVSAMVLAGCAAAAASSGSSYAAFQILICIGGLAACVLSVVWGGWAVQRFGSADPKPFVLDEFAGQWFAMLLMPASPGLGGGWLAVLTTQFILFRIIDVLKPPPASQFEALPGGWGILLDDVASGIYANLAGQAIWRFSPLAAWLAAAA